jgi:DNA-binding transcriptional ArsR family regulator
MEPNDARPEPNPRYRGEPNPGLRSAADIAPVAALFADRTRARIVSTLADGRALPASVIAQESGVSASTASEHLGRLVSGGVLAVEQSGRHRYYRLAGPEVGAALEALAVIAPQPPVRSLRESTRAAAMRRARTCYDHLAGRVGVAVTEALIDRSALVRTDGLAGARRGRRDRLSAPVAAHPYELGPRAEPVFAGLGVDLARLLDRPRSARPLLRFCVDWSEQRHHLAGALGAAVLTAFEDVGWLRRRPSGRAVDVSADGVRGLAAALGVQPEAFGAQPAA